MSQKAAVYKFQTRTIDGHSIVFTTQATFAQIGAGLLTPKPPDPIDFYELVQR